MTTRRSLKLIAAAWVLLGVIVPNAYADPITVSITSGLLRYPVFDPASLDVQFPNGSAHVGWSDDHDEWLPDFAAGCCTPGMRLSVSTDENFSVDRFPFPFGELQFGLETYLLTSVNFSVVALRDINVPTFENEGVRSFTGIPFTFRGVLSGRNLANETLVLSLIGSGLASVTLETFSPPQSFVSIARYEFDATPPAPIPEPGTLLLVATGIGVALRQMRKNQSDELEAREMRCARASRLGQSGRPAM